MFCAYFSDRLCIHRLELCANYGDRYRLVLCANSNMTGHCVYTDWCSVQIKMPGHCVYTDT